MKLAPTSRKLRFASILLLFYALLLSTLPLPAIASRRPAAVNAEPKPVANEAELKIAAAQDYGKLPLSFEANLGQSADAVRFLSRGNGYTVFLTSTEAVLARAQLPATGTEMESTRSASLIKTPERCLSRTPIAGSTLLEISSSSSAKRVTSPWLAIGTGSPRARNADST